MMNLPSLTHHLEAAAGVIWRLRQLKLTTLTKLASRPIQTYQLSPLARREPRLDLDVLKDEDGADLFLERTHGHAPHGVHPSGCSGAEQPPGQR